MTGVIFNEEQYDEALPLVFYLIQLDLKEDSAEFVELENLSRLVKDYENVHHPISE